MRDTEIAARLLDWYDTQARALPWRVGPAERAAGTRPDPYRVWLSEVMLQQTTVAAVKGHYARFTELWPDVRALARAREARVMAEWAGLGYYARARNLLKCARAVVREHGGRFPEEAALLKDLPGIGPYTAAAIAAIAFDRPETVVDGNVERVTARLFAVETRLPAAKPELKALAARLTPLARPGDHAQAMMDLGATICTPKSPACGICPLAAACAACGNGQAAELPRRAPKTAKPVREGIAWIARRDDGAWLLERRPASGLLGGMLGWPGTGWSDACRPSPPLVALWRDAGEVRHTFTHFHLRLALRAAVLPDGAPPGRGIWVAAHDFRANDLPSVMRKAYTMVHAAIGRS